VPIDGQPFPAELSAVEDSWRLTFDFGGKSRSLSAAELVRWGDPVEPRRGPAVVLADGGLLLAAPTQLDKQSLTAESDLIGGIRLPLEQVAGLVFRLPADRRQRDAILDRVAEAAGESDRVLLANGDEIAGTIAGLADGTIQLNTTTGPTTVAVDRAAAIVFNPALRRTAENHGLRAWVGLADGSLFLAAKLSTPGDKKTMRITLATGQEYTIDTTHVVFLQPLGGRVVFLSDLRPAEYRHVPFLDLAWNYRDDRNVAGGRLRCGESLYLKGIGVHSSARLTYTLDEPYERFQAELGIDDATAGGGSVRYRIFVDGKNKFTSEIVRGGMKPVPVSVDLAGAKRLDLVVDFADRADQLDHANWLDARLIRENK
jgi:hypothetical protein